MSTDYYLYCDKCNKSIGTHSRKMWGNVLEIEYGFLKFLVDHSPMLVDDPCEGNLRVITEYDDWLRYKKNEIEKLDETT